MNTSFVKPLCVSILVLTALISCDEGSGDKSLSIDAYTALGVPDPGKKWTMDDYTQAHNALSRLKWERPLELPLKHSGKSGQLFARMVSLEYLSFLQDSALSLNEKAEQISAFTKVYDYWIDVYTVPIIKENRYHREILDIQIFNLRLMEAMVNLAHKIDSSHDATTVGLKSGYEAIKENYLSCLHNDLRTQSHTSLFLQDDLDRMADSITASVLRNKHWLDNRSIEELNRSLRLVLDSTSSEHIQSTYTQLEKALREI